MKNIETNKKFYHRILKQDLKLKIVKADTIPSYSETEVKSLNDYIKKCKQKISFLTLANKVATSLQQYSCKTIEDAKEKANLIYEDPIIDYCLPQINKINVNIKDTLFLQPTQEEIHEYRQKLIQYREQLKKYKITLASLTAYLPSNIDNLPDYLLAEYYIDKQIRNTTRQMLNDGQVSTYYSDFIKDNTIEISRNSEFLKILEIIKNEVQETLKDKTKLLPTPRILTTLSQGKEQNIKLSTYYTRSKLAIENLTLALKKFAPNIYNEKLTNCTQQELEKFILANSEQIITYVNGAYLNVLEDRAFTALRKLAVEAADNGLVTTPDSEITVTPADIYKLAGIPYNEKTGYDTKQRLAIKDVITNQEKNLRKPIHIEVPQNHKDGNAISSSFFIIDLNWNDEKNQIIYQIGKLFFVNFQDNPDYYQDDVIGRNRLMNSIDGGFRNIKLYRLHQFIASSLRAKTTFNVTTLLEKAGLIKEFNNRKKKEALSKLQEYLDLMYEQKTLLKNRPVRRNSKSDKYGKYELERI